MLLTFTINCDELSATFPYLRKLYLIFSFYPATNFVFFELKCNIIVHLKAALEYYKLHATVNDGVNFFRKLSILFVNLHC